jgi:transcriptional/translational regulatory protein YebC/TACO1
VSGAAGEIMHTVVHEGMGPGGVSFLVEAVTDNTSRTVGHVKTIAMKNGANMEAKVLWQFVHKGVVRATGAEKIEDKDSVELACIEAGADDIGWHEDELVVIGPIAQLQALEKVVRELGFVVAGAELEYIPSQTITPSDEDGNRMMALVEAFEDDDDVTNVFTNIA